MLSTQTAHLLARYRAWADALTYRAVEGLPTGEGTKLRSTEFKSIIGTPNHIFVVDRVWQARIERRDHGLKTRNLIRARGTGGAAQRAGVHEFSVIHRRYKLRASRSPSGVTHTRISTGSRTIASDALAPVDTCGPYQSLASVTTDDTRRRRSNGKRLI